MTRRSAEAGYRPPKKKRRGRPPLLGGGGAVTPLPTVVALDPGTTTGWCVLTVHPSVVMGGAALAKNVSHCAIGEIANGASAVGENRSVGECFDLVEAWPWAAVVVEDFILRTANKERVTLSPVRVTAALSYALSSGGRKMWLQQPSLAMTTVTDARLELWGLYAGTEGLVHGRDALRHAVTFFMRAAQKRSLAAEAWPELFGNEVLIVDTTRRAGRSR